MKSRDIIPVSLLSTNFASSYSSTAVPTAIDLANYFPVGRREVLFLVNAAFGTTTGAHTATLTIEECASTATASFSSVLNYSGTTATWTTTAASIPVSTYFFGVVNYRYVRVRATCDGGTTGDFGILNVTALPLVRAG